MEKKQFSRRHIIVWVLALLVAVSFCACSSMEEKRDKFQASGQELFHQGPFDNGTNNIGEFLGLVHALALFKKRGWTCPVYTDSETAMLWVKKKKCKTKLQKDDKNGVIFELIARAVDWLKKNEYETQILKWDTEAWGEIPADYGRK